MSHKFLISAGFALVLTSVLVTGCGDSDPQARPAAEGAAVAMANGQSQDLGGSRPILSFHWLGKSRLATEGGAANFMALWKLPESIRLEAQTLDKLAAAPWRLWTTNTAIPQAASLQLRPLLNDLLQEEVYLESRGGAKQPVESVLAVRLAASRMASWRTNLPLVLQSIFPQSEVQNLAAGFSLWTSDFRLELGGAGEWILLSYIEQGGKPSDLKSRSATLLAAFQTQIAATQTPFLPAASNCWVDLSLDLLQANRVCHYTQDTMTNLPQVTLRLWGDGANVQTAGELVFPSRFETNLPAWSVPTNLVVEPLVGLTLMRSIGPILRDVNLISPQIADLLPSQFLTWQRSGPPLQLHFAAPNSPAAASFVKTYLPGCLAWVNTHLDTSKFGQMNTNQSFQEYHWDGLSLAAPSFRTVTNNDESFYHLGLGMLPPRPRPLAQELYDFATTDPGTVFFEWEVHCGNAFKLAVS
ncbi:MAG: hypothetical protein QM813_12415 [Verrucomicrobiota bacterium]